MGTRRSERRGSSRPRQMFPIVSLRSPGHGRSIVLIFVLFDGALTAFPTVGFPPGCTARMSMYGNDTGTLCCVYGSEPAND
jgi:hypothetical protein